MADKPTDQEVAEFMQKHGFVRLHRGPGIPVLWTNREARIEATDKQATFFYQAFQARTILQPFEVQNYKRLMALEARGIEEYRNMRAAPALTVEAVVSFINQLSPWNLATTGIDVLKAYVAKECTAVIQEAMERGPKNKGILGISLDEPSKSIVISRRQGFNKCNTEWRAALQAMLNTPTKGDK
jgi:hypothetical protein